MKKYIYIAKLVFFICYFGIFSTQCNADELITKGPTKVTDYRELPIKELKLSEVVNGLDAPWSFVWLPNGEIIIAERFGDLKKVQNGVLLSENIKGTPKVLSKSQGGLLDITLHPKFDQNNYIYYSYAHGSLEGNRLRIARSKLIDMELKDTKVIFEVEQTKNGAQHFGSRFQWLPDGTLLFSVGDGGNPPTEYNGELIREQAQKLNSHLGKIIRINDDGSIPNDNPFVGRPDVNPEIWSYGHRNVQGITYDAKSDKVFASEHGSKGGDELNYIQGGKNYGWPKSTYSTEYDFSGTLISAYQSLNGIQDPVAVWTPSIAPSNLVYYSGDKYKGWGGDIFLAAMVLRSNTTILAYATSPAGGILRISTNEKGEVLSQEHLHIGDYRVRDIRQGPDGYLYVLTDSTSRQSRPGAEKGALWRIEAF